MCEENQKSKLFGSCVAISLIVPAGLLLMTNACSVTKNYYVANTNGVAVLLAGPNLPGLQTNSASTIDFKSNSECSSNS